MGRKKRQLQPQPHLRRSSPVPESFDNATNIPQFILFYMRGNKRKKNSNDFSKNNLDYLSRHFYRSSYSSKTNCFCITCISFVLWIVELFLSTISRYIFGYIMSDAIRILSSCLPSLRT